MTEATIAILREDYADLSREIEIARTAVEKEMRKRIAEETERTTLEVRARFAKKLKEAYDSGELLISEIGQVIGTRDWSYVKRWRDLAGIGSRAERRSIMLEATRSYRFEVDETAENGFAFVLLRNRSGDSIPPLRAVEYLSFTRDRVRPAFETDDETRDIANEHFDGPFDMLKYAEELATANRKEVGL